jgi:hypothetical protein
MTAAGYLCTSHQAADSFVLRSLLLQFSARDYLETALMPVAGSGAAVKAKNGIRESIKSLFPDRDCVTLVRPMHQEAVSNHYATPCSVPILTAALISSTGARSAGLASCCASTAKTPVSAVCLHAGAGVVGPNSSRAAAAGIQAGCG